MKRSLSLGVILLLVAGVLLGGCGGDPQNTLTVYNWGDYIDKSILTSFEKEYGIKVIYEEFATNEDMYIKLKAGEVVMMWPFLQNT